MSDEAECVAAKDRRLVVDSVPTIACLPLELCQHIFSWCTDLRSLAKASRFFRHAILTEPVLYYVYANPLNTVLFYDFNAQKDLGPRHLNVRNTHVPSGPNQPFHTSMVQRFDITSCDFTLFVRFKATDFPKHQRIPLFADWVSCWSFIVFGHADGASMELRRNINSHGSDPQQGLIGVRGKAEIANGGIDTWTVATFTWCPGERQMRCYINGQLCDVQKVRDSVRDVTVQRNNHPEFCVGWKNDDPNERCHGTISHVALNKTVLTPDEIRAATAKFHELEDGKSFRRWSDIYDAARTGASLDDTPKMRKDDQK